jgi:hypothetical protein
VSGANDSLLVGLVEEPGERSRGHKGRKAEMTLGSAGLAARATDKGRKAERETPTLTGGAGALRGIAYGRLPSQQRFHDSTARFKGFSGPIGSGKSQALCHEALKLSYLNAGRTGLIGAPTYATPLPAGLRRSLKMG